MISLGIYKHYSGKMYQVIGVARHSETLEEMVVYQALYGDYGLWIRPAVMFAEKVTINGQESQRFLFVSEAVSKAPTVY